MPTYEYQCPVCGLRFERVQHFSDPPLTTCPAGHRGVRRIYSPPPIIFKGSGFYTTDYSNSGPGTSRPSTGSGRRPSAGPAKKGSQSQDDNAATED